MYLYKVCNIILYLLCNNHIGSVMNGMLDSRVVDCGFEHQPGKNKDYDIFAASLLST